MSSEDSTQIVRLVGKHLHLLDHLDGPVIQILEPHYTLSIKKLRVKPNTVHTVTVTDPSKVPVYTEFRNPLCGIYNTKI